MEEENLETIQLKYSFDRERENAEQERQLRPIKECIYDFFRTNISGILDAMYSAEDHFREMMMSDKANSLFSFEMEV